ncbi:MAG: Type phosphodiesterase / nucleotide pyrophosphatase [Blastocatellia bacterium]|nr:Type phosphodiesterase / nucleotide pyrophosphatase [Blastocatellia bacterium]
MSKAERTEVVCEFCMSDEAAKAVLTLLLVLAFVSCCPTTIRAQAQRVVLIKVDGLPHDTVERFVREKNPRTGKSLLPWIEEVFYQKGTRVANFYVRGMSLSGPSWSLLDTGQHLQIKGNVEFDRFTLHSYDYLNFLPFYVENAARKRIDMPGPEVLDELGLPLLMDAFPNEERYASFQLYQRGLRWTTLQRSAQNGFLRDPRELLDEWTVGFETRNIVFSQTERELKEKLNNPRVHYLDLYVTEFDHAAHHNRDRETKLAALQDIDALIGRVWMAIQQSPLADQTALIMLSDHGFNSDENVYSQGYNLVKLLGSAQGGGHHVITKRRLLMDYAIKSIYPLVPLITTTTKDSYYLKGQSTDYPTALLDFDGNERSSIHLRDSDLNVLHILLQQLQRKDAPAPLRRALTSAFFETLDNRRANWNEELGQLNDELGALHRLIEKQRALVLGQPKKWTQEETDKGLDKEAMRASARLESWLEDERQYAAYARTLVNLLALRPDSFDPSHLKIEDLIARGTMGDHNSIYELQNYVVGIAPGGFVLKPDGTLDMSRSFARVDYFALLREVAVRNNVQPELNNHPVDFVATRIPLESIAGALEGELRAASGGDPLWLYAGPTEQALILSRREMDGGLSLRYLPVQGLTQDAGGRVRFESAPWREGLPLKILEDQKLRLPEGASRADWLSEWHTDLDWLRALHKTAYSNGLIGLHEQLIHHRIEPLLLDAPGLSNDERLLRRFRNRQRELVEADLLVLANNHWNFDVRGFNPGGNHGSLFRISTHSTLMLAGGATTGIPRGFVVEEPYDSLSFVPTVLALTGKLRRDGRVPVPVLWERGFRPFPGRIIEEAIGGPTRSDPATPIARGH